MEVANRFWAKVDRSNERGCWLWTGSRTRNGYGEFSVGGKRCSAHRWAYEEAHGPVPAGMEIDHLCRSRACVKATHLESVVHRENILRGAGPSAVNARKTHCIHGHVFSYENTYIKPNGTRVCRPCRRHRQEAKRAACA